MKYSKTTTQLKQDSDYNMATSGGPNITTDGLVLHLDAGSVKSYPGSGNTWYDLNSNGNNGTLTNGPTYSDSSIVFDGAGDYVSITKAESELAFTSGFTWSIFVYIEEITNNPFTGFISTYVGTSAGTGAAIKVYNSRFEFRSYGLGLIQSSPNFIPLQKWIMLTVVWTPGYYYMYENGNLVKNGSTSSSYSPSTGTIRIGGGAYSMGTAADLNGKIGLVKMYNKALTTLEIQQNYNATKSRFNL